MSTYPPHDGYIFVRGQNDWFELIKKADLPEREVRPRVCVQGGVNARVRTEEKEGLIMCYKYWYSQETHSEATKDERSNPRREQTVEEEAAMKRAQEAIEKAKSAKPAPRTTEPVTSEKEKETIPA